MVRLYQMLASDGASRTPYVVRAREPSEVSLDLQPGQLGVLRNAMLSVVERGTARASRLADMTIAGKTATSQNPHGPDHGWFVGFGPVEKPEIVVGAIIEFARHGSSVAPLVARTIARYLGADETQATAMRLTLPSDSAPEPLQLLPGPIVPILPDTILREPIRVPLQRD
jgi:cell division protein FtsI/penicillin-binding protein 2